MKVESNCPICGEPTAKFFKKYNVFDLCKEHRKMEKRGEISLCPACKTWHHMFEQCDCRKINFTTKITCIICNRPSNGKHFCYKCWDEYKDKSIDIRLKNLKFEKIIDKYGNKNIPCNNGIMVRSRAEKIIFDFLFAHNIRAIYEKEITYTENRLTKTLIPDFYLPDYCENGLLIEYNELQSETYKKRKDFTLSAYKKLGFDVLILTNEDIDTDLRRLKQKLNIII